MKKTLSVIIAVLLVLACGGCKPAGDPAPELYFYKVVFNGRTYTTDGGPFLYEGENTEDGFLYAKLNDLGELEGDFPAGTRFYSMRDTNIKVQILAVMEDNLHYFLVTSYDAVTVTGGRSIFNVVGLENDCGAFFHYNKNRTRVVNLPLTAEELNAFNKSYLDGSLVEPAGRSEELLVLAYTGERLRFTLYENGALVYEACPQYAVDLGKETSAMLWGYIDG